MSRLARGRARLRELLDGKRRSPPEEAESSPPLKIVR
jgi:hypothetical protein